MNKIRNLIYAAGLALALVLPLTFTGCAHRLESGGAYAQTNQVPDMAFFIADSAFDVANSTVDAAFKFEYDNRALLWKVSPDIKHTLDGIRPQAWTARETWAKARKSYLANPVPFGLSVLETTLAEMQRLAATAVAALPQPTN